MVSRLGQAKHANWATLRHTGQGLTGRVNHAVLT